MLGVAKVLLQRHAVGLLQAACRCGGEVVDGRCQANTGFVLTSCLLPSFPTGITLPWFEMTALQRGYRAVAGVVRRWATARGSTRLSTRRQLVVLWVR